MCSLCRLPVVKNYNFGQILTFWGLLYRPPFTDEGKIWCALADPRSMLRGLYAKFRLDRFILSPSGGEKIGPLLRAKFHPHRCNVSPLRGEKPQNRPLSKLNTGRFALRVA